MTTDKNEQKKDQSKKDLFGLNPDESLLSVKFATADNRYLNEYGQIDSEEQE